ncbi:MAG: DUF2334 domain-containing protein [Lachnospiraceae bacterium]|nr:DUF2334 domain-containing protein [Lachnospiraceae bacterium]MDE7201126.1 DUF2334 domain-containing protein [Lachnospiraceae bacterium]
MKISIRMDDITPDMDWAKFMRFKALCDQYHIKPLIGVVPDNMDENLHMNAPETAPVSDFWQYLRELEKDGWCMAQHGVTHIYTTQKMGCFPLNRLSEFAGIGYEQQYEALKRGKKILTDHGIRTDVFMAPAHSFDRNTIKALKKLGFRRLTDGFGDYPYIRFGMVFYPISYKQSSVLKNRAKKGYTTFVVHANTMNDKDFERYEQIFSTHRDRLVSYAGLLELTPRKRGVFGNVREYLMAFTKFVLVSIRGLKV